MTPPMVQLGNSPGGGATRSLTVVWHSKVAQGWSVRFGSRYARQAAVQVKSLPSRKILSAEMPGLQPGSTVPYEVSLGTQVFQAKVKVPPPAQQPWTMAVLGDTGRNTPGERQVANALHSRHPDAVMVVGDIVYPYGRLQDYDQNLYPIFNANSQGPKIGAPNMRSTLWIGVTGNHDTAYRDLNRYPDGLAYYDVWQQPQNGPPFAPSLRGAKASDHYGRSANFSFEYGNSHITVLDSNTYAKWGSGPLRAWLEKDLAAHQGAAWRIVAFHHAPFHSSKKKETEVYMRDLAPLFASMKVDLVLCGHVHNYQRTRPLTMQGAKVVMDTTWNGRSQTAARYPVYVVTGAGGAELYDQMLADKPGTWKPFTLNYKAGYSFSMLSGSGRRMTFQQVSGAGTVIDSFVLTK